MSGLIRSHCNRYPVEVTGYIAITGKLNEQIVCRPTVSSDGQDLSDQIKNYKSIEGFTLQYCWGTGTGKINSFHKLWAIKSIFLRFPWGKLFQVIVCV